MLRQTDRTSHKSQLSAFGALISHPAVAFLLLTLFHGGHSQAIGQPQPIVARVGDDITLPCHVKPASDVFDEMLEWSRPDLNPRFVHVRRAGEDLLDQNPSYTGRTSVSINSLKQGDVSLKLSKVKFSDEGTYTCLMPRLKKQSSVQLVVGPVINITKVDSGVLQCESTGWYPEREVFWLDGEGNLLSAGPTETVRGPDGLYTVSSRVTVEKRHNNNFTCRVQQKNINQTRETYIIVPDDFFTESSRSSASTVIGVIVGIIFILAVVFLLWKWTQNKLKTRKCHGDEKSNSTSNVPEQESLIGRQIDGEKHTAKRETMKNQGKPDEKNNFKSLSEESGLTHHEQPVSENKTNNVLVQKEVKDPTGGKRQEAQQAAGKTNNHLDQTRREENGVSCPAEEEEQQDKNKDKNNEGQNTTPIQDDTKPKPLIDGQTNQLPAAQTNVDKKDEDKDTKSGNTGTADQDVKGGERQEEEERGQEEEHEKEKTQSTNNNTEGQDPTGGKIQQEAQQAAGKTNNHLDQTRREENGVSCPAKEEEHQDKNKDKNNEGQNTTPIQDDTKPKPLIDGQTNQLPAAQTNVDKKDEAKETKSGNTGTADQGPKDGERQEEEEEREEDKEDETQSTNNNTEGQDPTGTSTSANITEPSTAVNNNRAKKTDSDVDMEKGAIEEDGKGQTGGEMSDLDNKENKIKEKIDPKGDETAV